MNSRQASGMIVGIALVLGVTIPAQAGPPLICHVIEIGPAKTLPRVDLNGAEDSGYDLKNLTRDTLAILDSGAPVLVQMETLRRATLYARLDPQVAKELLTRLQVRAVDSEAAGHLDAMAFFDAGYLIETYQQWMGKNEPNPARGLDGYRLVKKAISMRGADPELEFAAALITLRGPESDHREHYQKALAGAQNDPLLARNLATTFNAQTMASMLRAERPEVQPSN